jgi:hypothetical protein
VPCFKPYSYDQTKLIPVDFNRQLRPGAFEFALNHLIDRMDLSVDLRDIGPRTKAANSLSPGIGGMPVEKEVP